MKVGDVVDALESIAPTALACEWDRVGLLIGDPDAEVSRVLVALTVTRQVYKVARRWGADMIVSHHPVIWDPLDDLRLDDPDKKLCVQLASAGIACYAAHTNLDVVKGGVSEVLADKLGLVKKSPLFSVSHAGMVKLVTFVPQTHIGLVREAVCAAGAGVIGNYRYCTFSHPGTGTFLPGEDSRPFAGETGRLNEAPERRFETLVPRACLPRVLEALFDSHPYEEPAFDLINIENRDTTAGLGIRGELPESLALRAFARKARACLKIPYLRVMGDAKTRVKTVAVLAGSGGKEASRLPADIDVYVTGDVAYHDAVAARERVPAIIDAGHAGTEKWIVTALAGYLRKRLKRFPVTTYTEQELFEVVTD